MDPYIILTLGGQQFKTAVCKKGGKNPAWADSFTFDVFSDQVLTLHLYDKDKITRDDYIGECIVPLAAACQRGFSSEWFNVVNKKGKLEGKLFLCFDFVPDINLVQQSQFNQINVVPLLNKSTEFVQQQPFTTTTTTTTKSYTEEIIPQTIITRI
jgi:Ca2+-dependent lipid-binding protein